MTHRKLMFAEEQRFTRPWVIGVVVLPLVAVVIVFGYGLYQQIVLRVPFGNNPANNKGLIICANFGIGIPMIVVAAPTLGRLVTTVTEHGLLIEFRPFRFWRQIPWAEVQSCKTRNYRLIREYGGLGHATRTRRGAYNVYGRRGVQLVLDSGERLLIGSQEDNKLARNIKAYLSQDHENLTTKH